MIIWITGQSGSGKTTLASRFAGKNTVILDGDILRTIWPGLGLTTEDRREQGLRTARLAKMLEDQGLAVIVAVICPFENVRRDVETICDCKWIYLTGGRKGAEYPYEPPTHPIIKITGNVQDL